MVDQQRVCPVRPQLLRRRWSVVRPAVRAADVPQPSLLAAHPRFLSRPAPCPLRRSARFPDTFRGISRRCLPDLYACPPYGVWWL